MAPAAPCMRQAAPEGRFDAVLTPVHASTWARPPGIARPRRPLARPTRLTQVTAPPWGACGTKACRPNAADPSAPAAPREGKGRVLTPARVEKSQRRHVWGWARQGRRPTTWTGKECPACQRPPAVRRLQRVPPPCRLRSAPGESGGNQPQGPGAPDSDSRRATVPPCTPGARSLG